MSSALSRVKEQKWFYEFNLPDGTTTECYLPKATRKIHETREKAIRQYLTTLDGNYTTALDISCHEGFFSHVLSEYFDHVTGIDKNAESVAKAREIASLLGHTSLKFETSTVEAWDESQNADLVLCLGLLYHVENPIPVLRKLASLAKMEMCIETQVLPFQIQGHVEDGSYLSRRDLNGVFGLCADYSDKPEGGLTDLALVPSRDALEYLLRVFGFETIEFYKPDLDDYEQFVRNHRVIIFAKK